MAVGFPNLGIEIDELKQYIDVFGFKIMFYGLIIGIGIIVGVWLVSHLSEKEGLGTDMLFDLAIWEVPLCIIGARIYYVIFQWDYYGKNPMEILNIRGGGLAIYGGFLTGIVVAIIYGKKKKVPFAHLADLAVCGLIVGQAIGRWGNFFNCEAFGGFSDGLFAMRINRNMVNASMITGELNSSMLENLPELAADYIQVHPTFLYESVCNLLVLAIMLIYRPHRKFKGAMFCTYLCGYGTARFFIEGLRTDQLKLWNTNLAVSQCLSAVLVIIGLGLWIAGTVKVKKNPEKALVLPVTGYIKEEKNEAEEKAEEKE